MKVHSEVKKWKEKVGMRHRQFIDLSVSIESGLPSDPPSMIPRIDYEVCCFPIKIKRASAGWVRPVAIIDRD